MDRAVIKEARGLAQPDTYTDGVGETKPISLEKMALSDYAPSEVVPYPYILGTWCVKIGDVTVSCIFDTKEQAEENRVRFQEWREAMWASEDMKPSED